MRNLKDQMNAFLSFTTPLNHRVAGMKFFWRAFVGVILIIITLNITALTTRNMTIKNTIFSRSTATLWLQRRHSSTDNNNNNNNKNKPYHTDRLPSCFQNRSTTSLVEEGDWAPIPGMTQTQYRARAELDRFIRRTNDWAPILQRKDLRCKTFV